MLAILWLLSGLVGASLLWVERTYWKYDPKPVCPPPSVIVTIVLGGSIFGGIALVMGISMILMSSDIGAGTWWQRPICKHNND